jgi:hypothetical protein
MKLAAPCRLVWKRVVLARTVPGSSPGGVNFRFVVKLSIPVQNRCYIISLCSLQQSQGLPDCDTAEPGHAHAQRPKILHLKLCLSTCLPVSNGSQEPLEKTSRSILEEILSIL